MSGIHLELKPIIDDYGKKFYVAKLKGPFTINCNEGGVAFMVFVSEEGCEELQITNITGSKKDERK